MANKPEPTFGAQKANIVNEALTTTLTSMLIDVNAQNYQYGNAH